MAEVDFSNAVVESCNPNGWSPTGLSYISMFPSRVKGKITGVASSGSEISNDWSTTILQKDYANYVLVYRGTFNTSGTEFYIQWQGNSSAYWKFSNITFNAGDTFTFQVNCSITNHE